MKLGCLISLKPSINLWKSHFVKLPGNCWLWHNGEVKLDGILFFSDLWKAAFFCCYFVIFTRHIWVEDYFIHSISGGKPYFWIQSLVQFMFSISFSKPIKICSAVSGHLQPIYVPYFIALKTNALAKLMPICGKWVRHFAGGHQVQFSFHYAVMHLSAHIRTAAASF